MILNLTPIIEQLKSDPFSHQQHSPLYVEIAQKLLTGVSDCYAKSTTPQIKIDQDISFYLPFYNMGAINTTHLFGIDEVIILSFYSANKNKYKTVLDLGANIGLHSIALDKLGYDVTCFEADPDTYKILNSNLKRNGCFKVNSVNAAAASFNKKTEFTRVCGNLTGSHLSGAKENPYGKLECFEVDAKNIGKIAHKFDLIKIDIEGQEADVFCSIPPEVITNIDFMMEINGDKNAIAISEYADQVGMKILLQKTGWSQSKSLAELPRSHRDGSIFITSKSAVPW